jgi:hypothetical protein
MQEEMEGEVNSPITDLVMWEKMKTKKPDLEQPQPQLPQYIGNTKEKLNSYCEKLKGLHPEVDEPMHHEVDETALIMESHGKPHGRFNILDGVVHPTMTLTRVRATLTPDHPSITPRPRPTASTADVSVSHFHLISAI